MVFYLVGLGLGDVEDITVKGLNAVKKAARVYLESYTSILCYGLDKSQLEAFYGRPILEADRTCVEQNSDDLLNGAETEDVVFLVVGDPFGATTHTDLVLRYAMQKSEWAKERGVEVVVIHNASIMNAVACCGLQLYRFGETVSIVMWTDTWRPDSFYDRIATNLERGLHTLCLLDIKTKEQSIENMMKGTKIYEPARYLTASAAAKQLLEISEKKEEIGVKPGERHPVSPRRNHIAFNAETMVVALARVGWKSQKMVYCSLSDLCDVDMGDPLHSLVIPGDTHPLEDEMLASCKLIPGHPRTLSVGDH